MGMGQRRELYRIDEYNLHLCEFAKLLRTRDARDSSYAIRGIRRRKLVVLVSRTAMINVEDGMKIGEHGGYATTTSG